MAKNTSDKIDITENTEFNAPSLSRRHSIEINNHGTGEQKFWRYKNGYGASVVRFMIGRLYDSKSRKPNATLSGSYGASNGLWELAVIKFKGDKWALCYDTRITSDVIGYLTEKKIESILKRIKRLKRK